MKVKVSRKVNVWSLNKYHTHKPTHSAGQPGSPGSPGSLICWLARQALCILVTCNLIRGTGGLTAYTR